MYSLWFLTFALLLHYIAGMATNTVALQTIPTVTIFVRHSTDCLKKADYFYKSCRCPKHLRWFHGGKQYTRSAKTRTWSIAEEARRKVEGQFSATEPTAPVTIAFDSRKTITQVVEFFLIDKRTQSIGTDTINKYERELSRFSSFMARKSVHFPNEIQREHITLLREGWAAQYPSTQTRAKVQERLRSFLTYCYDSQFIDRVPPMSTITMEERPTIPLTQEQYEQLLDAALKEFPPSKAKRIHALIQLMRFSGLAITDAVTLERSELQYDSKLELYRVETSRQKTGTHVSVLLPPDISAEILSVMPLNTNPKYIFWNTGKGKITTAVCHWHDDLRPTFRRAGMPEGHPHQLRDTFACSMLADGAPMEEVSKMLGHDSIKTTEKYYAKWNKDRQDRTDTIVIGTFNKRR